VLPVVYQQANKSITRLGITQDNPNCLKKVPNGTSYLTLKKKVVHGLPIISFAHIAPLMTQKKTHICAIILNGLVNLELP